ncbi:hypothetical protein TNCV_3525881 [Trichonephila clavipes]|nr:hypothetical protein TNCV_3525881 [Trichonephila clavipes]
MHDYGKLSYFTSLLRCRMAPGRFLPGELKALNVFFSFFKRKTVLFETPVSSETFLTIPLMDSDNLLVPRLGDSGPNPYKTHPSHSK